MLADGAATLMSNALVNDVQFPNIPPIESVPLTVVAPRVAGVEVRLEHPSNIY